VRQIQLVFGGKAWPAAHLLGDDAHLIGTSGHGRAWTATTALGWWRDFAEIDLKDREQIETFLQRRGDPSSILAPGVVMNMDSWPLLQAVLQPLAGAWSTRNDGIDRVAKGSEGHETALRHLANTRADARVATVRVGSRGFELHFQNLGDFMIGSAVDMLTRGAMMRRCEVCGSWFEIQRSTGRICSAACKTRKAKEGK
jgi:hypothetical protein